TCRRKRAPPASPIPASAARPAPPPLGEVPCKCRTDRAKVNPRPRGTGGNMTIMGASDKKRWCGPLWRFGVLEKATHCGRTLTRLPIIAFALALGLTCGGANAGRSLPTTDNPYCSITTCTLRDLPEQAMSTLDSSGRPVIVVSSSVLNDTPAYGR